jgi:hypothetical protein
MSQIDEEFVNNLNLGELVIDNYDEIATTDNTKNVLRNFGNAQNHYALYHHHARAYLE